MTAMTFNASCASSPGKDHLANSVCSPSAPLDLNRQDSEEEHLDHSAAGVPESPRHAILPRHVGRLQERCGPRPLRHDHRGRQACFYRPPGGVEELRRVFRAVCILVQINQHCCQHGEEGPKSQQDCIARFFGQGRIVLEEASFAGILGTHHDDCCACFDVKARGQSRNLLRRF